MKRLLAVSTLLLFACGGTVADLDAGGDSGTPDSAKDDAAPFACGSTSCSGDAICIHPCCGGAMICAPLDDGGTCPAGLELTQTCPPEQPCGNTCTPPPPYCGTTSECSMPQGHDCYLLCQ